MKTEVKDYVDPETGKTFRFFLDAKTKDIVHMYQVEDLDEEVPEDQKVEGSEHLAKMWSYGLPGTDLGPYYEGSKGK